MANIYAALAHVAENGGRCSKRPGEYLGALTHGIPDGLPPAPNNPQL